MKKKVELIEKILGISLVYIILIIVVVQVIARYLFNQPLLWSEPLGMILFTWMVFIGAASTYYRNEMLTMDIISDRFPPKMKKVISIIFDIIIVAGSIYLIPSGIKLFVAFKNVDIAGLPLSQVFIFSVSLVVIVLFAVIGLHRLIIKIFFRGKNE